MDEINKIRKTLTRISATLKGSITQDEPCGLLNGYFGRALFFSYYYKLTGNKRDLETLNYIVRKTIEALAKDEVMYSHCNGIAGIAWGLQHLIKNELIEQDEQEDIFEELNEPLFNFMKHELSENKYDFLHQGLGVALYFLERLPDRLAQTCLEETVVQLRNACVMTNAGTSWKDTFTNKSEVSNQSTSYNLGLAHGVPAILAVLSMIHEKGIAVAETLPLIENGVQWLLANKNKPGNGCASLYPTMVTGNNEAIGEKQSRLGWCYGDLGIGITLLNIGTRLRNNHYKQEAYSILEHTLKYRNSKNGNIGDASLCHGSMGISHIYRRAYLDTGESLFLKGAEEWLQQALQMANWKDGLTGFKYLTRNGFENNYNLLEGITGIGLALIAAIDDDTIPAWDRCLLLS